MRKYLKFKKEKKWTPTWYDIQASFKPWEAAIIVNSAHLSDDTRFCKYEEVEVRQKTNDPTEATNMTKDRENMS